MIVTFNHIYFISFRVCLGLQESREMLDHLALRETSDHLALLACRGLQETKGPQDRRDLQA